MAGRWNGDADYPGVPLAKRIKIKLMQMMLPLIRGLLMSFMPRRLFAL